MRKRGKVAIAVVIAMLAIMLVPAASSANGVLIGSGSIPLYAGQDWEVGFVEVSHDSEYIYVEYFMDPDVSAEGWVFTEFHLAVELSEEDVPQTKKGNPIPGNFEFSGTDSSFVVPMPEGFSAGAEIVIAAHAGLYKPEVNHMEYHNTTIVSDTGTEFYDTVLEAWLPSVLTWVHPSWGTISGASWIWESYYSDTPRDGDTISFRRAFSVVGTPTAAQLEITTDNEYSAYLNGSLVGSDATWQTIETYNVLPTILTSNTLEITAANWPWNTDSSTVNPGGLLYKLTVASEELVVDCPEQHESAWAAGIRFVDQGNWGTYFLFKYIEQYTLVESVFVPGTSITGIYSTALEDGKEYKLETSGTYKYANWSPGDAGMADAKFCCRSGSYIPDLTGLVEGVDCVVNPDGTVWVDGRAAGYVNGLQIRIDNNWAYWIGNYNTDHEYTQTVTGTGSPIHLSIWDNAYGDNAGGLTVDIYLINW